MASILQSRSASGWGRGIKFVLSIAAQSSCHQNDDNDDVNGDGDEDGWDDEEEKKNKDIEKKT